VAGNAKAREALEKLRLAEARYEALLADLAEERKKRLEAEQVVAATHAENEAKKAEGEAVAATLAFDELTTRRRLIDQQLIDAGWDVGASGADTEQVRQEVKLGDGTRADYVLYGANGKPLAVVEAKKTAKDAQAGAEQARLYADALRGRHRPAPGHLLHQRPRHLPRGTTSSSTPVARSTATTPRTAWSTWSTSARTARRWPASSPTSTIADRMYQLEAVKRVGERFSSGFRKALLVQATGTGKTRVAVSLVDVLMRAGWAKRILFLCDRRELLRQADRVFKEHLPGEPRVVVSAATADQRDKRIYLATYPAMMKCYEDFDVGFFDLVIADESHRSIYKKYKALFWYFDALQIGLTATPVEFVGRDTFEHFGCPEGDPTSNFGFRDALSGKYLAPFRVIAFTSQFRDTGFKYSTMDDAQKNALEEQDADPSAVEFEPGELDRLLFSRDTTRNVWRSLMDQGVRDATGSRVGKTIVFARNHLHALHLADVFAELYPQYGSTFCKIIDNQEPRAEQLIDDFKSPANDLTIAISVDMLDTGLDVPEVVNLVFAKPVRSYVKFWQMIGRGTRLCRNLFGPGKDKTEFVIFDHWRNFQFFEEDYVEKQPAQPKSLLQHLFEARVALAAAALEQMDEDTFHRTIALIQHDVKATRTADSIEVRDRARELELLADMDRLAHFAAATQHDLLTIVGPLQHCRNIRGDEDAYRFDLLATRLQLELVRGGPDAPRVADLRGRVEEAVELLAKNQNPVKAHAEAIGQVRNKAYWATVKPPAVDVLRQDLRSIMKHQQALPSGRVSPLEYDVPDRDFAGEAYAPRLEGLELVAYTHRVEKVLREQLVANPTLQRLRDRQPVSEPELEALAKLVLQIDDKANVKHLIGYQPEPRRSLAAVFRGLVGLDEGAVERAFSEFVHKHQGLSPQQLRFLQLLKNHLSQYGTIELERLYEAPFTTLHADGVDGVFPDPDLAGEILAIVETFQAVS
jgi:type I restriction enzyme R subunit